MNERIKELAGKANIHFSRIGILDGDPDGSARLVGYSKIEKFAELIVCQCGYYADVFESAGCPVDMDPTETKPSDYIKKHFGIEK